MAGRDVIGVLWLGRNIDQEVGRLSVVQFGLLVQRGTAIGPVFFCSAFF
jgi:hypothetical protein